MTNNLKRVNHSGASPSCSAPPNADNVSGMTVYRVTEPFLANGTEGGRLLTVRKGSVLVISSELKQFGLINATCEGQELAVFTRDLEECAERIERKPNASATQSGEIGLLEA